ncbi:peptide methionine sulfoxide reductase [Nocardiopsis protaetiae]|uniref:peptide methionine sulfoxide reductase n=1 Tax=Nocardiopsis protaetiae TaxID=3382270 RepID=UPI00387B414C
MDESPDCELDTLIRAIPEGWSRTDIGGRTWAVTRTTRAEGKAISLEAELLGTGERLGANVRLTSGGAVLRPCEVSEEKVMWFLRAAAAAFSA